MGKNNMTFKVDPLIIEVMKILVSTIVFILAVFSGQFVFSEDVAGLVPMNDENLFVACQRLKELRWLYAFKLDNGRCKTYYSKEGYVQVVSSASYFSSCEAVLETVKKNIEEGGFKCATKRLASIVEIE
jgi:hypothetical protein